MNATFIKVVNNVRYLLSLQWLCELDMHHSELVGWAHPHLAYTRCRRCSLKLTDSFHEEMERAKGAKS